MTSLKRLLNVFALYFLFHASCYAVNGVQLASPTTDGLIVKFKTTTSKSSQIHALSSSGVQLVKTFSLVPGLSFVKPLAGESVTAALQALNSNPNVIYAEPDYKVTIATEPRDPDFAQQWALNNTGQTGGIAGADIKAINAWDLQTGNDVVVAVIDTGIDYTHPDLKNNTWVNVNEIPDNGVDDDANGLVDDYYGWDFSNNDNDPIDDMGHGTHVAGIIAAEANNNVGIAGVNWKAKVMGVKFIDANGVGITSDAIQAINYAVKMGARISNNSWGGGGFSQALYDTLVAAEQSGHLFIAAAGNNGLNTDDPVNSMHYPSSYELGSVISVAASDAMDERARFSNYGPVSVDLAAPGSRIRSTWINSGYFELDGTSMAAPFVAGAATLLLASRPDLNGQQVRDALLNNVDPLPAFEGLTTTGGRLNLYRALSSVTTSLSLSPMDYKMSINDSVQFSVSGGSAPYHWQVENPAFAQIDAQTGYMTAFSIGRTRVSVTDASGFTVTSNEIVIDQLFVTPDSANLLVGESLRFNVRGGTPPYQWQSSNTQVASIDSASGDLFALSAGTTQVSATDSSGLLYQTGNIDVVFIPDVVIAPQSLSLPVGDSYTFRAQGGVPPYVWRSEDPLIANIDASTGVLTAYMEGITRIAVKDGTGLEIFSGDIEVLNVQVSVNNSTMRINESQALTVVGGLPPFEWRVSNSLVATIDNSGMLTALTPGSVKVTLMDARGYVAATDVILVTNSSALNLTLTKTLLGLNDSLLVNAAGGVKPYQWHISDSTVIALNNNSLSGTAIGAGVTQLTVTDSLGETITSPLIEVRDIRVSPGVSSFKVNDVMQFSAVGGVGPYSWQVSSRNVASIDANGSFKALQPGVVTVTAVDTDGISGSSQTITVSAGQLTSHQFSVSPKTAVLSSRSGSKLQFVATGGLEPYTFSLSNPGIGSIDSVTGEYSPRSAVTGDTTVVVIDADGHITESGIISVR